MVGIDKSQKKFEKSHTIYSQGTMIEYSSHCPVMANFLMHLVYYKLKVYLDTVYY